MKQWKYLDNFMNGKCKNKPRSRMAMKGIQYTDPFNAFLFEFFEVKILRICDNFVDTWGVESNHIHEIEPDINNKKLSKDLICSFNGVLASQQTTASASDANSVRPKVTSIAFTPTAAPRTPARPKSSVAR